MFSKNKLSLDKQMIKAKELNIPKLNSFINGIKGDMSYVKIVLIAIIQTGY